MHLGRAFVPPLTKHIRIFGRIPTLLFIRSLSSWVDSLLHFPPSVFGRHETFMPPTNPMVRVGFPTHTNYFSVFRLLFELLLVHLHARNHWTKVNVKYPSICLISAKFIISFHCRCRSRAATIAVAKQTNWMPRTCIDFRATMSVVTAVLPIFNAKRSDVAFSVIVAFYSFANDSMWTVSRHNRLSKSQVIIDWAYSCVRIALEPLITIIDGSHANLFGIFRSKYSLFGWSSQFQFCVRVHRSDQSHLIGFYIRCAAQHISHSEMLHAHCSLLSFCARVDIYR